MFFNIWLTCKDTDVILRDDCLWWVGYLWLNGWAKDKQCDVFIWSVILEIFLTDRVNVGTSDEAVENDARCKDFVCDCTEAYVNLSRK